jgi:nucleotidyltransferase/DNA polymerase involved in DNA repair
LAGRRYSPFVSPDAPDGIWLDITGCASLFGTEKALLKDLHRRVAARGLSVQIAIADTTSCAHAVARHVPTGRPVIIEPGDHRKTIAILPIENASHVRNAVARFNQVKDASDKERDAAWKRIEAAAQKHGVKIKEKNWCEIGKS